MIFFDELRISEKKLEKIKKKKKSKDDEEQIAGNSN